MTNNELLDRKNAAVPRGLGMATGVFAARAKNAERWDVEGKRYIDFAAGIAVVNTGHCHPRVLEAVSKQLSAFTHTCAQVAPYELYAAIELICRASLAPDRLAAIIVEPVQGEGGCYVAPPELMLDLCAFCDRHGAVLIADEVQTGFARTGKIFAMEHYNVVADLSTTAKALGGVRAELLGQRLEAKLQAVQSRAPHLADIRRLGFMVAAELIDPAARAPRADLIASIRAEALKRGLILLACGAHGNVIRLLAPLTIEDEVFDEALQVIGQSVEAAIA